MIAFEIRNGKYDDQLDEIIVAATERRSELQELAAHYEGVLRTMLNPAESPPHDGSPPKASE